LITTFVPPASCLSDVYDINGLLSLGPPDTSHCYPYGWASSIYYSPGICPQGYTTLSASLNFLNSSSTTETIATCCPRLVSPMLKTVQVFTKANAHFMKRLLMEWLLWLWSIPLFLQLQSFRLVWDPARYSNNYH
jgi:hypothetical protein